MKSWWQVCVIQSVSVPAVVCWLLLYQHLQHEARWVFRPIISWTLFNSGWTHSGDQSLCVGWWLPALLHPSYPQPAGCTLRSLAQFPDSLPSVPASCSNCCHESMYRLSAKPSNANFHGEQPSTPALFSTEFRELGVLRPLPLISLLTPCFPWHCQLNGNELLPSPWPKYLPAEKHSYNI